MYTALKKQKVPAFIRYPGNFHGGWPPWDMCTVTITKALWFPEYSAALKRLPAGNSLLCRGGYD